MSEAEALTRNARGSCRRCGEPLGSFQFCLSCGASVVADDAEQTDAADESNSSRVRRALRWVGRRRTPVVVIPLLAVLAVVGGTGAQMLLAEVPAPEADDQVTCWDGETARSATWCTLPSGDAGLRWVFPTFRPQRDDCIDVLDIRPDYERPAMYECDFRVGEVTVEVAYMQLAGVEPARRYFDRTHPNSKRQVIRSADGVPSRYVWRRSTEGPFELTTMYVDYPYAVTIAANKPAHRERALRRLEFRPPEQVKVASD